MKKFIFFLFALCFAFILIGCGGSGSSLTFNNNSIDSTGGKLI